MTITMGERFKSVRKHAKMTQKDFAESLGITQTTISGIEKNAANASTTLIKLVCLKYNIDEEWLSNGNGRMLAFPGSWGCDNCDGLIKKYEAMKILFERHLENHRGNYDNLFCFVESFSFFISITTAAKLSTDNVTAYLKAIYNIMDHMEKFTFHSSVQEKRKNRDYERMYKLKLEEEEVKKIICDNIAEIAKIYEKNAYGTSI